MAEPADDVIRTGREVEVELPESPTTGFRWHLDPAPGVSVIETGLDGSAAQGVVGGAGTRVFRLHVVDEKSRDVVFSLRRAWDPPGRVEERRVVTLD